MVNDIKSSTIEEVVDNKLFTWDEINAILKIIHMARKKLDDNLLEKLRNRVVEEVINGHVILTFSDFHRGDLYHIFDIFATFNKSDKWNKKNFNILIFPFATHASSMIEADSDNGEGLNTFENLNIISPKLFNMIIDKIYELNDFFNSKNVDKTIEWLKISDFTVNLNSQINTNTYAALMSLISENENDILPKILFDKLVSLHERSTTYRYFINEYVIAHINVPHHWIDNWVAFSLNSQLRNDVTETALLYYTNHINDIPDEWIMDIINGQCRGYSSNDIYQLAINLYIQNHQVVLKDIYHFPFKFALYVPCLKYVHDETFNKSFYYYEMILSSLESSFEDKINAGLERFCIDFHDVVQQTLADKNIYDIIFSNNTDTCISYNISCNVCDYISSKFPPKTEKVLLRNKILNKVVMLLLMPNPLNDFFSLDSHEFKQCAFVKLLKANNITLRCIRTIPLETNAEVIITTPFLRANTTIVASIPSDAQIREYKEGFGRCDKITIKRIIGETYTSERICEIPDFGFVHEGDSLIDEKFDMSNNKTSKSGFIFCIPIK